MPAKKTTTKKPPKATAASPASRTSHDNRLRVRMYRQGLGDCFLITIPRASGGPFFMMIDCGVVLGTSDPSTPMTKVLKDIAKVTGGHIDLLVVTHEHWDHVSGFSTTQVQKLFDDLQFEKIWFAWTEDPKDKLANKLRAERRGAENALRMAAIHLGMSGATATAERVNGIVTSFFGAKAGSTSDALDYVKKRANGKPRYCQPGEDPIELTELPGIRFWVLGPPKDEKLIKKSNPGTNDAYGLDAGPGGSQAMLLAALTRGMGVDQGALSIDAPIEDPFDGPFSIPMARAEHLEFFQKNYYADSVDGSLYDHKAKDSVRDQSWRRIDSTWSEAAETLALQLDSATNNTSLVLALEVVATGEVLLFPGDAQAGNWLSWQDLKWQLEDPATKKSKTVTGPDLLARTVFYKVGHHGSHNATLKAKGLELMVNDNLIAMIPVDHDMAVKKRWGRMPLPDLVDRIMEKTHGRVLRVDDKVSASSDLVAMRPKNVEAGVWQEFCDRVTVEPIYYEVTV